MQDYRNFSNSVNVGIDFRTEQSRDCLAYCICMKFYFFVHNFYVSYLNLYWFILLIIWMWSALVSCRIVFVGLIRHVKAEVAKNQTSNVFFNRLKTEFSHNKINATFCCREHDWALNWFFSCFGNITASSRYKPNSKEIFYTYIDVEDLWLQWYMLLFVFPFYRSIPVHSAVVYVCFWHCFMLLSVYSHGRPCAQRSDSPVIGFGLGRLTLGEQVGSITLKRTGTTGNRDQSYWPTLPPIWRSIWGGVDRR